MFCVLSINTSNFGILRGILAPFSFYRNESTILSLKGSVCSFFPSHLPYIHLWFLCATYPAQPRALRIQLSLDLVVGVCHLQLFSRTVFVRLSMTAMRFPCRYTLVRNPPPSVITIVFAFAQLVLLLIADTISFSISLISMSVLVYAYVIAIIVPKCTQVSTFCYT